MNFARRMTLILAGAAALAIGLSTSPAEAGKRRPGGFSTYGGVKITDHTLKVAGVDTLDGCREYCWGLNNCQAFQFDKGSKECRWSISVRKTASADADVVVGVFNAANQIPKLQALGSTRAKQRDAPGHDLYRLDHVPKESMCSAVCSQDNRCQGYVYRESTESCWIKDDVPMRDTKGGLVSAYVPWPEERANRPEYVVFRHVKLSGALWRSETTRKTGEQALTACRDRCVGEANCKAAVLDWETGRCNMYKTIVPSSIVQDPQQTDDRAIIKFNFKDGVRFVALKQGTRKAADQPGNDLRMQKMQHGDLCRSVCALDRSCSAVTMNNAWTGQAHKNECYLKSRARNPTSYKNNYVETSWLAGDDR